MIVNRKRPNLHTISWVPQGAVNFTGSEITFHAGANFVPDEVFFAVLEKSEDFKSQVNAGFMTIEQAARKEYGKGEKAPTSLQEAVAALDEKKALVVVSCTLDGADLREIERFDRRKSVVKAAQNQFSNRQTFMNSLQPVPQAISETAPIPIGEF